MIVTVERDAVAPRVSIATSGTDVYRVQDGVRTKVRGLVVDGFIYDYELPQNTPVTYEAAEPGSGTVVSPLVEMPDLGVWLIHLGDPSLSQRLTVASHDGWGSQSFSAAVDVPGGDAYAVTFGRGTDTGAFRVKLWAREDVDGFRALVADGSVLFMSAPYNFGTGSGYVALGDVVLERVGQYYGSQARYASFPYKFVRRPEVVMSMTATIDSLTGTINSLTGTIDSLGA